MDPFLHKLLSSSPEESEKLFKEASQEEREAVITFLSSRHKPRYLRFLATVLACVIFKALQELAVYLYDG